MQLRAISIDDDPMSLLIVRGMCKHFDYINLEETFTNPIMGAEGIRSMRPDLVFLDMEMPELTGIQVMDSVPSLPKVIVMSSNMSFKDQAFEHKASAFLQKPVTLEKFSEAVEKVWHELNNL